MDFAYASFILLPSPRTPLIIAALVPLAHALCMVQPRPVFCREALTMIFADSSQPHTFRVAKRLLARGVAVVSCSMDQQRPLLPDHR